MLLCLFLLAVLACLPFFRPEAQSVPSPAKMLGRFHVVLLHFPIGLLLLAFLLELARQPLLARWLPQAPAPVSTFVLVAGAFTAFAAAFCGWLLSLSGGYDPTLLDRHFYLGLASAAGALLALVFRLAANQTPDSTTRPRLVLALLAATNVAVMAAGHFGGVITHGDDYLTEYAPNFVRRLLGKPPAKAQPSAADLNSQPVFAGLILPILQDRCSSCHNEQKAKGDLRLDTYAHVMSGEQHVVAGQPDASELIKRLLLPLDNDDHMPPPGKPQPTDAEIAILEWWIKTGASEKTLLKQLNPPPSIQAAIKTRPQTK